MFCICVLQAFPDESHVIPDTINNSNIVSQLYFMPIIQSPKLHYNQYGSVTISPLH